MGTTFIGTTETRMGDQLAAMQLEDAFKDTIEYNKSLESKTAEDSESSSSKKPFHAHFGLGHLGCGLIIPALVRKGISFALINRPSKQWGEVVDSKRSLGKDEQLTLAFKVNGEPVGKPLPVVTDVQDLESVGECSKAALTEDKEVLKELVRRATSFSSSLGPALKKVLPPMFELLDDKEGDDRPILYAAENEHGPVDELEEEVKNKVNTLKCMVDRICIDRTIDVKERVVDAKAEEYEGKIIVLKPLKDDSIVPFAGDVTVPSSEDTAMFLYKRKFSIVNGIHGALAFLTLRENNAKPDEDHDGQSFPLIKPTEATGDIKKEIDSWLYMRCVELIDEFGIETAATAVDVSTDDEQAVFDSLLEFGREILERMSSMDDNSDRIFEGDRRNCWTNRVKTLWVYTQKSERFSGSDTPMGRFIKYAECDEQWAVDKIAEITEYGAKMCDEDTVKDFKDTAKSFNKKELAMSK